MKFVLFLCFLVSHGIYFSYNLWVTKQADSKTVLGWSYDSFWTYTLAALIVATPILSAANYIFAVGFHLGHKLFGTIWIVLLFFLAAQICTMTLLPVLFFKEWPNLKMVIAVALGFCGLFLAMSGA